MDVLRHAKEAAVNACNDHKREVESLTEQLEVTRNKLASTKQQLQVPRVKQLFAEDSLWSHSMSHTQKPTNGTVLNCNMLVSSSSS